MESQLLTEHQKEVLSRQRHETAQLYPDFSSSPAPRSASSVRRLDFSQEEEAPTRYATPTMFAEEQGPMDNFVISSPTPKATEKAQDRAAEIPPAGEGVVDTDIPSSPPQIPEEYAADKIPARGQEVPVNVPARTHDVARNGNQRLGDHVMPVNEQSVRYHHEVSATNEPESVAPSKVLNEHEVVPDKPLGDIMQGEQRGASNGPAHDPSPCHQESEVYVDAAGEFTDGVTQMQADAAAEKIITPTKPSRHNSLSPRMMRQTTQSGSKRKHETDDNNATPSKRSKPGSPLKRMISWMTGSQNKEQGEGEGEGEEEEDEAEDCIVVASQPELPVESTVIPNLPASAPASMEAPKRKPGRPRRSMTPLSSTPAKPDSTRQLKRNSSVLSGGSELSSLGSTPATNKSRRVTRSQVAKNAAEPTVVVQIPRTNSRTAEKAATTSSSSQDVGAEDDESVVEGTSESGDEDANSQLRMEEAAARQGRRIVKPKSILERLKSILADCKTLVLGREDEMDMDEVLSEIRREVYEAGKRGREQKR